VLNGGHYDEFEEWASCSDVLGDDGVIAAGICGQCVAAIDLTTKARFCIKKVTPVFSPNLSHALLYLLYCSCGVLLVALYKCYMSLHFRYFFSPEMHH